MIRLERGPAPKALAKKHPRDGLTETEKAIAHYTNGWNGKTGFEFKRYGEDEVRRELQTMAHGKCAYCESRIHVVTHEDVEHWRPKGEVVEADGTALAGGYYWLGAEWTNLLPSCPHCNRRSRKDLSAPGGALSGKQALFPVADPARRWRHHDAPNEEEPLLLDPVADEPADFLAEVEHGVLGEKHPAGRPNQRARESIAIYGLNRPDLVHERQEHRRRVEALVADVEICLARFDEATSAAARERERSHLRSKLAMLRDERAARSPYLFVKRPLIDDFVAGIGPELARRGLP